MKKRIGFDVFRRYYRRPRGAKFAKANGLKDVPPDAWDDLHYDSDKTKMVSYLMRAYARGLTREVMFKKLLEMGFRGPQAEWLLESYFHV